MLRKFVIDKLAPSHFFTSEGFVLLQELYQNLVSLKQKQLNGGRHSQEVLLDLISLLSEVMEQNTLSKSNVEAEIKSRLMNWSDRISDILPIDPFSDIKDELSFAVSKSVIDFLFQFDDGKHLNAKFKRILSSYLSGEVLITGQHWIRFHYLKLMEKYRFEMLYAKQIQEAKQVLAIHKNNITTCLDNAIANYQHFFAFYQTEMLIMLEIAKNMRYNALEIGTDIAKIDQSYEVTTFYRPINSKLIFFVKLLDLELSVNEILTTTNLPLVSSVVEYLERKNTQSKCEALLSDVDIQLKKFIDILTDYINGKDKWISPNEAKKTLANNLRAFLQAATEKLKSESLNGILFNIYNVINETIKKHDLLCDSNAGNSLSLGEFANKLDAIKKDFFLFIINNISEENDPALQEVLKRHKLKCDILFTMEKSFRTNVSLRKC